MSLHMNRHRLKAVLIVALSLLLIVAWQFGASTGALPSPRAVLMTPLSDLNAEEPQAQTADVQVETTAAPQARSAPVRVAGKPLPPEATEADDAGPARVERVPPQLIPDRQAKSERVPQEQEVSHEALESKHDADNVEDEAQELAQASAERAFIDAMAAGGDLVRQGLRLPRLIIRWTPADVDRLARDGHGMVVAEWRGHQYRVLSQGKISAADDFVLMTMETRSLISNRGFRLSANRAGDREFATRLDALGKRLVARVGGSAAQDGPEFTFFVSEQFERYLAMKQLGALRAVGFAPDDPRLSDTSTRTVGVLTFAGRRPVYLITHVFVGAEMRLWNDPEAQLGAKTSG